jgi:hypothetical protein
MTTTREQRRRLEALEAQAEAERPAGQLTAQDCAIVLGQVAYSNIQFNDGRATRRWACNDPSYTAELDTALARLNEALAREPDPPTTMAGLALALAGVDGALDGLRGQWVAGELWHQYGDTPEWIQAAEEGSAA